MHLSKSENYKLLTKTSFSSLINSFQDNVSQIFQSGKVKLHTFSKQSVAKITFTIFAFKSE